MSAALSAEDVRRSVLVEVIAEREALAARETQAREDMRALIDEADKMTAEHDAACAEARGRHVALPAPPVLPDGAPLQELLHRFIQERVALHDRERQTLAQRIGDVEEAWQDARPDLDSEAAALLRKVDALAARYRGWHRLVYDVRLAQETANPNARMVNGPSARMRPVPDAVAVLTVAAHGADLLASAPIRRTDLIGQRSVTVEVR